MMGRADRNDRVALGSPIDFTLHSGDLASFLVPAYDHPWFGSHLGALYERLHPRAYRFPPTGEVEPVLPQESTLFLGWVVLALGIFGWLRMPPGWQRRLLVAVFAIFAVLALGGRLRVLGIDVGLPLPAALLQHLPVVRAARAPGRHVVLVTLALAVAAGAGWSHLRRPALRAVAAALVAFELAAVPLPLFATAVAPVYRRLLQLPGSSAVLELPFGVRDGRYAAGQPDPRQIFAQTVHHRPILTGMASRWPLERWQWVRAAPLIGTLLDPRLATDERRERDRAAAAGWLARWNIRLVVVHPRARGGFQQRYLESVLPVARREELPDGTELLWPLAPSPTAAQRNARQ